MKKTIKRLTFEYVVNDTTTTTGENTNEATQNRKEPMMMEHDELCVRSVITDLGFLIFSWI